MAIVPYGRMRYFMMEWVIDFISMEITLCSAFFILLEIYYFLKNINDKSCFQHFIRMIIWCLVLIISVGIRTLI